MALMASARSQAASSRLSLVTARQGDDAHGGAVSLLGMGALAHHPLHQGGDAFADAGGHVDQTRRRHIGVALMRLGHVLVHRDMATALGTTDVAGNTLMVEEDLDGAMGEPHIHPAAISRWGTE